MTGGRAARPGHRGLPLVRQFATLCPPARQPTVLHTPYGTNSNPSTKYRDGDRPAMVASLALFAGSGKYIVAIYFGWRSGLRKAPPNASGRERETVRETRM